MTAMCCLPGSELICRRSGGSATGNEGGSCGQRQCLRHGQRWWQRCVVVGDGSGDVSGRYGGMAAAADSGRGVALLRDDSAFNIFEIIDNIGLKFADRRFIADNNPVTVHLQNAYRPHVVYAAFNRMVHSAGFFGAGCQNHNFFGVHNRPHAHG